MRSTRSTGVPVYPLDEFRPRDSAEPLIRVGSFEEGMLRMPHRFRAHRHDFFELIWLTRGRGKVQVDFQNHPVAAGHLVALAPGQVHAWSLKERFDGTVVGFYREFFSLSGQLDFLLELPFFLGGAPVIRFPTRRSMMEVSRIFAQLRREYTGAPRGTVRMQTALITQLLTLAERAMPAKPVAVSADTRLAQKFLAALGHEFKTRHTLEAYAAKFGVTANHLGDAVRRATGKSAGAWIRERVLLEAKRLLAHSDFTSAQIGYALGFSDPAYFGNAFRKATAQSPGAFRKSFRKKLQNRWE